jgi:hypothetical protein
MQLKIITLIRNAITLKPVGNGINVKQGCEKKEAREKIYYNDY